MTNESVVTRPTRQTRVVHARRRAARQEKNRTPACVTTVDLSIFFRDRPRLDDVGIITTNWRAHIVAARRALARASRCFSIIRDVSRIPFSVGDVRVRGVGPPAGRARVLVPRRFVRSRGRLPRRGPRRATGWRGRLRPSPRPPRRERPGRDRPRFAHRRGEARGMLVFAVNQDETATLGAWDASEMPDGCQVHPCTAATRRLPQHGHRRRRAPVDRPRGPHRAPSFVSK